MGAYTDLQSLIALEYKARGFSFLPSQPVHSLLAGRRGSRMRGRGLNFEELRGYVSGDDIRVIDWRVTARMRKPFVRVYMEERDRPTLLVVDQRVNMFFGSRASMKSVIAAEAAALVAWRVFQQGDRVGAVVFNDRTTEEIRPKRSRASVLRILEILVRLNKLLHATYESQSADHRLNDILRKVAQLARRDYLIVVASDFDGANDTTRDLLRSLSQHNDVIALLTYDPLAVQLPPVGQLVVSDGELQVELPFGDDKIRKTILEASDRRMRHIFAWQKEIRVPVMPLSTAEDTAFQIRHLLGQVASRRIRR
ncbi:MAG TPA: DUF58 domain-containing protein [Dongiaceae bacterium]|nr:DUF58 domain-containing protein [Dongiaceae bacterium]